MENKFVLKKEPFAPAEFYDANTIEVMKNNSSADYLRASTYFGYLAMRVKQGDLWNGIRSFYRKIRRFTLISGIIKSAAFIIALLEKSAILLLFFSAFLILLPAALGGILILTVIRLIKYMLWHKKILSWLRGASEITIYLSTEKIFNGNRTPLFLRMAETEASKYEHPVIILSKDRFNSVKWYSLNLLAVRADYFFLLKSYYFRHSSSKFTYIAVS